MRRGSIRQLGVGFFCFEEHLIGGMIAPDIGSHYVQRIKER